VPRELNFRVAELATFGAEIEQYPLPVALPKLAALVVEHLPRQHLPSFTTVDLDKDAPPIGLVVKSAWC
jgi:hypothetical protein